MKRIGLWIFILLAAASPFTGGAETIISNPLIPPAPPLPPPPIAIPPAIALHPPSPPPPVVPQNVDLVLAWDATGKQVTVTNGTPEAHYAFFLTNISSGDVVINSAVGSCGCTVARLPVQPWVLGAGSNGQINVTMNLAGKFGTVPKTVTVSTDKGVKMLTVTTTILPPAAPPTPVAAMDRESNQKLALADRQAVFKGDCARCHAAPAAGKMGAQLYQAVCGVCHEANPRASMVPDLHAIKEPTNAEFWKNWITLGKPGTLMPAFAMSQGGILSDEQIGSLVIYLTAAMPSRPAPPVLLPPTSVK